MKTTRRWMLALALSGGTLFAPSCISDFRDAALTGLLDYVTAATFNWAETLSPFDVEDI